MKFWRILKLTLGVVLVAGIIQSASMTSYCTEGWYNDTNVQEHAFSRADSAASDWSCTGLSDETRHPERI